VAKKRKALNAKDVVKDPTLIEVETGTFVLLNDRSTSSSFENMLVALDLIVPRGWQIISMSTNLTTGQMQIEMYVLLQRSTTTTSDGTPWPYEP
jgi:hypothetical protein